MKDKRRPQSMILSGLTMLAACTTLFASCYLFGCILAGSLAGGLPGKEGISGLVSWFCSSYVWGAMKNTLIMTACCLFVSVPLGTGTAIFLAEYTGKQNRIANGIRFCSGILSGIPSILYGMFGMIFFVSSLRLGYSMLAGSLTLAVLVLPLFIQTGEEALRRVPEGMREGSLSLGAGKLATLFHIVLPQAATGILSGILLAVGRIVGETAALLYTSGTAEKMPESLLDSGRTLAVQLYLLSSEGALTQGGENGAAPDFFIGTWRMALLLIGFVFLLQRLVKRLGKRSRDN